MRGHERIRVGVFQDVASADKAVERLIACGFPASSISVVCPNRAVGQQPEVEHPEPAGAHTPEAAAAGGAIGALLGGLVAAVGIAATGGTGLLVAGPLLGAAATGGVLGSFVGAMTTRGFEHEIADYYDQALTKGQILVSVEPRESDFPPPSTAERVLADAGAEPLVRLRKS